MERVVLWKENYEAVKRKTRRDANQVNVKRKEIHMETFYKVFKIAEGNGQKLPKCYDQQCIRSDEGMLAASDEDRKIHWKSYHEELLKAEFA